MKNSDRIAKGPAGRSMVAEMRYRVGRMTNLDDNLRSETLAAMDKLPTNPRDAAAGLRRCVEILVNQFASQANMPAGNLDSRISALQTEGVLPKHIASHMHTVRKLGNCALHPDPDDPPLQPCDVSPAGAAFLAVLEWQNGQSPQAAEPSGDPKEMTSKLTPPQAPVGSQHDQIQDAVDLRTRTPVPGHVPPGPTETDPQPRTRLNHKTRQYYVYENWQAGPHKAKVHFAHCSFCNHGQGTGRGVDGLHGKWHGPFDTIDEANEFARQTGGRVSPCGICNPY